MSFGCRWPRGLLHASWVWQHWQHLWGELNAQFRSSFFNIHPWFWYSIWKSAFVWVSGYILSPNWNLEMTDLAQPTRDLEAACLKCCKKIFNLFSSISSAFLLCYNTVFLCGTNSSLPSYFWIILKFLSWGNKKKSTEPIWQSKLEATEGSVLVIHAGALFASVVVPD